MKSPLQWRRPNAEEQALKRQWLQHWQQDRSRLLLLHPFTASLALHLDLRPVVDSRIPTAATDGACIYFNPLFLQRLSESQRLFVLAHEVWHCVAGHFRRQLGRDQRLWNLAIDHEVNSLLLADGFDMPADAVYFPHFADDVMAPRPNAETVYQWLLQQPVVAQQSFDLHAPGDETPMAPTPDTLVLDPDFSPASGASTLQQQWRERFAAALQRAEAHGSLPADFSQCFDVLRKAQTPWQQVLRQFVQHRHGGSRSWQRLSRRHYARGLYLPGMQNQQLDIVVALDTSGSTRGQLPQLLAELRHLLGSFDRLRLRLIQCDTRIIRQDTLQETDLGQLQSYEVHGMGGTDLRPVFADAALSEAPDCLLYFTDGCGPAPEVAPAYPVLWVLCANARRPADWGQVLHLPPMTPPMTEGQAA